MGVPQGSMLVPIFFAHYAPTKSCLNCRHNTDDIAAKSVGTDIPDTYSVQQLPPLSSIKAQHSWK